MNLKKIVVTSLITLFSFGAINNNSGYSNENYTGVIIDCSNLGLIRAMTPVIKDNKGEEIYPSDTFEHTFNFAKFMEEGIVTYEKSLDEAKKSVIAGRNPMIIKAVDIEGILKSNPVITRLDAVRLLLANNEENLFSDRKIIIVY